MKWLKAFTDGVLAFVKRWRECGRDSTPFDGWHRFDPPRDFTQGWRHNEEPLFSGQYKSSPGAPLTEESLTAAVTEFMRHDEGAMKRVMAGMAGAGEPYKNYIFPPEIQAELSEGDNQP